MSWRTASTIITSPSKTGVKIGKPGKIFRRYFYCHLTLLAATKLQTQAIEMKFRDPLSGDRRVNLDAGYIGLSKVVLASITNANQRIDLNSGIYAEATRRETAQSLS